MEGVEETGETKEGRRGVRTAVKEAGGIKKKEKGREGDEEGVITGRSDGDEALLGVFGGTKKIRR